MIRQYIELGDNGWQVYIYYNVNKSNIDEVKDALIDLNCPDYYIVKSTRTLSTGINTGMTYSDIDQKVSLVCIGRASSAEQFVNTVIHEAKHVQSHICLYYGIDEDGEQAAYLMGYIAQRMYRMLQKVNRYGRF